MTAATNSRRSSPRSTARCWRTPAGRSRAAWKTSSFFVGSTLVARAVYERGTAAGKRVLALGGAKNHMLVLPDADVDLAADAAVSAGYGSAGERCMAISVVVTVGGVADPLVEAIRARVGRLRVGPGTDPDSEMGRHLFSSRSSPGYRWLDANAGRFGLANLPSEPWHWSTNGK